MKIVSKCYQVAGGMSGYHGIAHLSLPDAVELLQIRVVKGDGNPMVQKEEVDCVAGCAGKLILCCCRSSCLTPKSKGE